MVSREIRKLAKYLAIRTVSVGAALVIALLVVIVIANLGGKVDEIVRNEVEDLVRQRFQDPNYEESVRLMCISTQCPDANETCIYQCKIDYIDKLVAIELSRRGLDKPFAIRLFYYLRDAISLNLGRATRMSSDRGSQRVWDIIVERLPQTILLFTTANLIIFFINLFGGLALSRRYGSFLDRLSASLAPLSSLPGWFYGLFMIMIFGIWLRILPAGGMVSIPPPEDKLTYALDVLRHMVLPIMSWIIAYIPIGIYSRRTFFLLWSTEEYVEYAKARGLPGKVIERRYILRPTLPPIITGLVLTIISSWMGAVITERIFNWPGLGMILAQAISTPPEPPVIIGVNTVYAYLLAISVIILDLIYGIVDPRVRVGGE